MGEYEPKDSREVTQKPGHTPGEPPRTGPREQQARASAQRGTMMAQDQQQGRQMQAQGAGGAGPSEEQQARSRAAPDGELNNTITTGPLQGDQPQAIDNQPGVPAPEYDQYEVNAPQNMHHDREAEAKSREQAEAQSGEQSAIKGLGYGASDGEEMADAPDASERGYGGAGEERERRAASEE